MAVTAVVLATRGYRMRAGPDAVVVLVLAWPAAVVAGSVSALWLLLALPWLFA